MTIAAVSAAASASTLRGELAEAEEEEQQLQAELQKLQQETVEARHAGAALLSAIESAMAPLMEELAEARLACGRADLSAALESEDPAVSALQSTTVAGLEAEIKHLELDISHFQDQAERLQVEERSRTQELQRLSRELGDAAENLAYEKHRARHFDLRSKIVSGNVSGLVPAGVGKRTMEVSAEQKLRAAAETRSCQLTRDVTRLATDTSLQQLTIETLDKKLASVRKATSDQDHKLAEVAKATADLHRRLNGDMDAIVAIPKKSLKLGDKKKKKSQLGSTGRLPQLSF